jgi:hypothetical protein
VVTRFLPSDTYWEKAVEGLDLRIAGSIFVRVLAFLRFPIRLIARRGDLRVSWVDHVAEKLMLTSQHLARYGYRSAQFSLQHHLVIFREPT